MVPTQLNLGSGKDFRPDFLNADAQARVRPDWLVDITKPLNLPINHLTTRFGEITIGPESFDLIVANDVLEHLPDLVTAMTNCLKLLKIGGEMQIHVPYDLSYGAWQDPTHVRGFNENSWLYYTDWAWYLGWYTERFKMTRFEWVLSRYGQSLIGPNHPFDDDLIRTPRAVDAMQVTLMKVKYE